MHARVYVLGKRKISPAGVCQPSRDGACFSDDLLNLNMICCSESSVNRMANTRQAIRDIGLTIGIDAPTDNGAIALERQAVTRTSGDRDHARQISWYIELPVEVLTPGKDGTLRPERKDVISDSWGHSSHPLFTQNEHTHFVLGSIHYHRAYIDKEKGEKCSARFLLQVKTPGDGRRTSLAGQMTRRGTDTAS